MCSSHHITGWHPARVTVPVTGKRRPNGGPGGVGPRVHASSPLGTVAHPPAGRGRHRTAAAPQRPLSPAAQPARRWLLRRARRGASRGASAAPAFTRSRAVQERVGVFLQQAASVAGPRRVASGGSAAGRLATSVRLPLPAFIRSHRSLLCPFPGQPSG